MSRLAAAALTILLAASASGCGSTTIDAGKAERFLRGAITPAPKSVACPRDVQVRSGHAFSCSVVAASGRRYRVMLHIVDSGGRVSVSPRDVMPG